MIYLTVNEWCNIYLNYFYQKHALCDHEKTTGPANWINFEKEISSDACFQKYEQKQFCTYLFTKTEYIYVLAVKYR